MKLVTAIVQAYVLDDLRDTLLSIGIKGMTISAAVEQSFDDMNAEFDRGRPCLFQNAPDIVLETVVGDAIVAEVVEAISTACHKTASGGIPLSVSDVVLGVRIRNAELVTED